MARAMRKKILIPIITVLILFPLMIFVLSYTRFFNDEIGSLFTRIVDEHTNARLYIGKIHGSILGSFWIDGIALVYNDKPIALIDTVRISHLPLSIITKTVEVLNCELVNPRFYLVRSRDGTFNVDHIGKQSSKTGGESGWAVILKNLKIRGGEFVLYDSTKTSSAAFADTRHHFDPSDFDLRNIEVSLSGNISADKLSATVKNISLVFDPAGIRISSLKFDFFTSGLGTEVSGLSVKSDLADVEGGLTLAGQSLLDQIDLAHFRQKHITVNLDAKAINFRQVEKFFNLPINPISKADMNCYASGDLDTLYIKQFSIRTDSSFVPLSATFYNLIDSSITMKAETRGASINPAELSKILNHVGMPDMSQLETLLINASVDGHPSALELKMQAKNGETEVTGEANSHDGLYVGELKFHGVHLGDIFSSKSLSTKLTGEASFKLKSSSGSFPEGKILVRIDSSTIQQTSIRNGTISISAAADSLNVGLNLATTKGNVSGTASVDLPSKSYRSNLSFTDLDVSSFVNSPTLSGLSTGDLSLSGEGFNIDSLDSRLLVNLDHSTLSDVPINNATFIFTANTESANKNLSLNSPFVDASISGSFVPDKITSQLSGLFSALADNFISQITGKHGTPQSDSVDIADLNASLNVKVKDARFLAKLLGVSELYGDPQAQMNILSNANGTSFSGTVSADTFAYSSDSLQIHTSQLNTEFNLRTDNKLSVWNSGSWSVNTNFHALDINHTQISSKILRVNYGSSGKTGDDTLSITSLSQVDSLAEFYIDASGRVGRDSIDLTANTLLGKLYGVSFTNNSPVHIVYSPEVFTVLPTTFSAGFGKSSPGTNSNLSVEGEYSLIKGMNLQFKFSNILISSLQKIARLDTNSLKLSGKVNGDASLVESSSGVNVLVRFDGNDIAYNRSKSKLISGKLRTFGNYLELSTQLYKPDDSSRYAIRIDGTVPLSDSSSKGMNLKVSADSLNISFLTPFLSGVDDLEGAVSGDMVVSGNYSLPDFKGELQVVDGKIRLAANQINYLFTGTIVGQGDKLVLAPVTLKNMTRPTSTTMVAKGTVEIQNNTIAAFDVDLDGSLLVLNSTAKGSDRAMYGTAIVGSGAQVLKLKGSLLRPLLAGSGSLLSTTLTLLPLQSKQTTQVQEVIYRFPVDSASEKAAKIPQPADSIAKEIASGTFIDSLRYDLNVETRDNVSLRMIFNPTTNEELDAILGGKLYLSNLSGGMELTGDVNILPGSGYIFYGKKFDATGKLAFMGDPLNPTLDIAGTYRGQHADTSATGKPQNVVVQLRITGTFNQPGVEISMTVDNIPYPHDQQTNAVSFILTGQFEDELTSAQKQSAANNLWSQYGAGAVEGFGSSYLSGYLTNLLGKQFDFIQSVGLQYDPNASITDPSVQITSRIGKGTIKVRTPVITTDIGNTGFSFDYPLALVLRNMVYLEASRNVAVNNRLLSQRETIDMLRLFYQISF